MGMVLISLHRSISIPKIEEQSCGNLSKKLIRRTLMALHGYLLGKTLIISLKLLIQK